MRVANLVPLLVAFVAVTARAATVNVTVSDFAFTPSTVNIAPGDTVQWNFTSTHTSTSDATTGPEVWDSGVLSTGSFSHTFTNVGNWPYHCTLHTFMTGTVSVVAAAPTLASISPTSGSTAGGTSVTLTGTNFDSSCGGTFGGTAATALSVASATSISATTPAHAAGAVNVAVMCTAGSATLTGAFTYAAAVTIISVSPSSALPGATITINGSGFQNGASVTFNGAASPAVTFVSATTLQAVVPNIATGAATIVVTNPDASTASFSGFTVASIAIPAMSPSALLLLILALAGAGVWAVRR